MATKTIKSVEVLRYSEGFKAGLSSAVLEWLLIFLLFINAVFSFLVTKFARLCELKIPCVLCSRLDHVLGNENPGFYRDLLCGAHKLEISSLVFCHVHDKLADAHGTCEGCLFSSVTEKKSNSETYRLLVGKLGSDHGFFVGKDPMLDLSTVRHCSCCNELWKTRVNPQRLLPKKSISSEVTKSDSHLHISVGNSDLKLFDGLKKRRALMAGCAFDPLSHVGYSELKITSDSESEVPLSDDDNASTLIRETNNRKDEFVARRVQPEPHSLYSDTLLCVSDEVSSANKMIEHLATPAPLLDSHDQYDVGETHHMTSSTSIAMGHGLEELNWQQFEQKPCPPSLSDLISLHDVSSPSDITESVLDVSRERFDMTESDDIVGTPNNEQEGVCKLEAGLTPAIRGSEKDQVVDISGETFDIVRTGNVGQISSTESGEESKSDTTLTTITGPILKGDQVSDSAGPSLFNSTDLGDAYKLAVCSKGGQASSMFTEQHMAKDPAKVNDDFKLLHTKINATQGSDPPLNDMSPRVRGLREELNIPDGSSTFGLDTFQKRISIDRNESGFESLDGSVVSEIEGESLVDRMKRQLEYDRKCMGALYKELDEERNASAVAANQAMAMITRLQEEKAALHMEALQYLRMMEEQAEYDVEALQKANDLLAEREKEIQDLEADLDYYRIKYPEDEIEEKLSGFYDDRVSIMRLGPSDISPCANTLNGACVLQHIKKSEDSNNPEKTGGMLSDNHMSIVKHSLLDIDDERIYISQCLKRLENKLNLCSDNGDHMEMCNGVYSEKEEHGLNDMEQDHSDLVIHGRNQMEENGSSVQNSSYRSRGGSPAHERSSLSAGDPTQGNDVSGTSTKNDLVSIESEVLDLNERLEILEADKIFLEHAIISLQNDKEGIKFIEEIAHHLRELRRIGIRRREKDVA